MKTEKYSQFIATNEKNIQEAKDSQKNKEFEQYVSEMLDKLSNSKFVEVYDKSGKIIFRGDPNQMTIFRKNNALDKDEDIGGINDENGKSIFRFGPVDGPNCVNRERVEEIFQQLESKISRMDPEIIDNQLNKQYSELSAKDKTKFLDAQSKAMKIIFEFIKGSGELSGLTKKEESVLVKIKTAYEDFKNKNPNKKFAFKLRSDIDKQILKNIGYYLAFDILNSQKEISENEDFETFKWKRGTVSELTDDIWWYQYTNIAAKKLKESDEFKYGKERIYFDIPLDSIKTLRNLSIDIAQNEKIPIDFKHLDIENTTSENLEDSSEITRFVANFASVEDAKSFYRALQQRKEYTDIKSDRNLDYYGHNIDGVANYASGYREEREALNRIARTAKHNQDNTFSYESIDGSKKITVTEEQYYNLKDQFEKLPNLEEIWEKAKI